MYYSYDLGSCKACNLRILACKMQRNRNYFRSRDQTSPGKSTFISRQRKFQTSFVGFKQRNLCRLQHRIVQNDETWSSFDWSMVSKDHATVAQSREVARGPSEILGKVEVPHAKISRKTAKLPRQGWQKALALTSSPL